jgi:plastocyanin
LRHWIKRGVAAMAGLAVLGLISMGLLIYADYSIAGNGSNDPSERLAWTLERGDHLHYAGHLLLARVFDLCPCSRRAADAQYYYAKFHAITPRQQEVLRNSRPGGFRGLGNYILGPFAVGFDWLGDGVFWLRGNRPARMLTVNLDQYAMDPAEIHVLRGTTVVWRNVDELGEAHTVTADPGQLVKFDSDFLEPDETFEFVFTERGRYTYYCSVHGGPGLTGMSGVVVVD